MKPELSVQRLAKLLSYVLGRRPDEFGLVPDARGYVRIKELLQAVCEEDGWRHVRRGHIDEVLLTLSQPGIEVDGDRIRAQDRERLTPPAPDDAPPGQLYTCVRQKAYPHVLDKGIFPAGREHVVLSADRDIARRIGRRRDNRPVVLTVHTRRSQESGTVFLRAGDTLYLADRIPADAFHGPALPKERPDTQRRIEPGPLPKRGEAGTFVLDPTKVDGPRGPGAGGKKQGEPDWKKNRRRARKRKHEGWS
jgi:putative RNA 2'-phosphotransferase